MGRATRTVAPEDATEVEGALAAAEDRLAALRTLGVRAPELFAKGDEGRAALGAGDLPAAQARADEIRIVVKLAAAEIERLLNRGELGAGDGKLETRPAAAPASAAPPDPAPDRDRAPEVDLPAQVQAVVEDAFGKALYSKALRQMVEIIAAERLREFLGDRELVDGIVGEALARHADRQATL